MRNGARYMYVQALTQKVLKNKGGEGEQPERASKG